MRFRTWPVAALGLAGLLGLIVVSLAIAHDRATFSSGALEDVNTRHRRIFADLRQVRTDVYLSAIYVRDYLLDNVRARDPEYREQLAAFRASSRTALANLAADLPEGTAGRVALDQLRSSLDGYWTTFEPLFFWTPAEKAQRSAAFVRQEVIQRREDVLAMAREIEALNDTNYSQQRGAIVERRTEFQDSLWRLLWQTLVLGLVVSAVAVNRLRELERRAEEQRVFAETAEQRMRTLSQQLVATQEEERRKLSRELHDHVGQLLTGLRMSIGRIERTGQVSLAPTIADSRLIIDDLTRIVRDLASGLRPSMLDDLGLQPALEWLGRDVSRRCGLQVTMTVDGELDDVPDAHRTCAYRVVQEALTNVTRHAAASRAVVTVRRRHDALMLSVRDDGAGFRAVQTSDGLGLRGMEERVKELRGSVDISSAPAAGTTLTVHLPLPREVRHARLAG
jgi:signal transduction histidine kinase